MTETTAPPKQNFRHDFFQSEDKLVFTLYARNIKSGDCHVDTKPDQISVHFKMPDESEHDLTVYPFGEIVPDVFNVEYKGVKVVITFTKKATV